VEKRRRVHYLPLGKRRALCASPGTAVSSEVVGVTCPRCLALLKLAPARIAAAPAQRTTAG